MRFDLTGTIAAPATPAGTSALAVIRVSGNNAVANVSLIFSEPDKLASASSYQAVYGFIKDGEQVLDEVICLVYKNPHSYTGEDMVEISGHGNPDLSARILQLLLKTCRLAEPGEYTFRAFMNHKLDLAQAEAVNDLIHAQTGKAEAAALNQLKGNLSREILSLLEELQDCRLRFELSIDFADQDLPELNLSEVRSRLEILHDRLQEIFTNGKQGIILRDGFTVVLCGAPNVGKSSIFNKFLEENRAIVTSEPGTTRDYLQEWLSLEGFPVKIIDTAGLRETAQEVEQLGIDRTKELILKADLVIYISDPSTLSDDLAFMSSLNLAKTVFVLNKIDLQGFNHQPTEQEWSAYLTTSPFAGQFSDSILLVPCSVILEDGISRLRQNIANRLSLPEIEPSTVLVTNIRHLAAIERALANLDFALGAIKQGSGYEYIAFDLIQASSALLEITGAVASDDLLEQIFSSFCIGK
jgi:tRNA modification GTPase